MIVSQPLTPLPPIYKVKQQKDSICDVLLNSGAEGSGISPVCPAAPAKSHSDAAPGVLVLTAALGVAQQCDS